MKVAELFDLRGRTAVLTGGMGQLGAQYACALAAHGARVAVFDMTDQLKIPNDDFETHRDAGQIRCYHVDITDADSIRTGLGSVTSEGEIPRILVNNAALDSPPDAPAEEVGPFETYPEASFDTVMDVNVKGTLLLCQVVGGAMAEGGGGSIINISSAYGILSPCQDVYEYRRLRGETFYKPVAYSVSKSAILNLTRYLATYWAGKRVRVNTLTPGGVFNHQPEEFLSAYCKRVPMDRMADEHEMNGALIFLASDASSYVTGTNLIVDGGLSAW